METALIILPAGTYRAAEYLQAARRLGVDVVTASDAPQAFSRKMGDHFLRLPLEDPVESARLIVAHDDRLHLDAVVAVDDQGLLVASLAAEALSLRHSPPAAVRMTRDKASMRLAFSLAGVSQPRFLVVSGKNPETAGEAAGELGLPVVVKPVGLSGSRGVIRADSPLEAVAAARRASAIAEAAGEPAGSSLLVESFVPGPEIALEGVLSEANLEVVTIFDKPEPLEGPYFEETYYVTPSRLGARAAREVIEEVRRAVGAIGLREGPVHAELRLPDGGRPVVIEVAARTIGGRCSKALLLAKGASLEELILARALGRKEPAAALAGPAGVLMIPIPLSGRLLGVHHQDEARAVRNVTGVEVTVPRGQPVRALPEADRYLGFVFAAAPTRQEVEAALREANDLLQVEIAPSDPVRPGTVA